MEVIWIIRVAQDESSLHVIPQSILEDVVIDLMLLIVVDRDDCELEIVAMARARFVSMTNALDHPQGRDVLQVFVSINLTLFVAPIVDLLEGKRFVGVFLQLAFRKHRNVSERWHVEIDEPNVGSLQNRVPGETRKFQNHSHCNIRELF